MSHCSSQPDADSLGEADATSCSMVLDDWDDWIGTHSETDSDSTN